MELLCVLAAVAALFCGCTVLTLKCRVPASVAPLTALSLIVAVLTLAAMAGVLYPITWAVYALCLAGGVWVLATRKNHAGAAQKLFTPGSVLFWGMALAFTVYFFVRQPMATGPRPRTPACRCWRISSSFWAIMQIGKFTSVMTFCIFLYLPPLSGLSRAANGVWPCRWPPRCGACRSSSRTTTTPST